MAAKKKSPSDDIGTTVEVVHISSGIEGGACGICGGGFGDNGYYPHFERQVNHYLGHPGCRLLHVGQESSIDGDGRPYQSTVAVVAIPRTARPSKYHTGR
ncbi:hypothetical protein WME88_34345 [Sorangium sp. So ce216]